jgi:hypothetical protein
MHTLNGHEISDCLAVFDYLKVWDKSGKEYRISHDELVRILRSVNFAATKKRKHTHLSINNFREEKPKKEVEFREEKPKKEGEFYVIGNA